MVGPNGLDLPELRQVVLLPVLNLTMVWNRGVTFGLLNGLGAWGHVLLVLVALGVVGALVVWLRRAESWVTAVAIGAIAGGAIGNVIDRLRFGAVVDFIQAQLNTPWGNLSLGVQCRGLGHRLRRGRADHRGAVFPPAPRTVGVGPAGNRRRRLHSQQGRSGQSRCRAEQPSNPR